MTQRRKRIRPPQQGGAIGPTPERMAQIGRDFDPVTEAAAGGMLKRTGAIRVWSQLENLHRNGLITTPQYDAGEQYHRDWYLGFQASAQVTMRWSEHISGMGGSGTAMDAAERRAFHARRFAGANGLLETMGLRKSVHWLVINDVRPREVGHRLRGYRGRDQAKAAGTTAVAIGLQCLARFYGLSK
jgi:hypothetical protein